MRLYETYELRFQGEELTNNYADIFLTAAFTCGGETRTVKGFYDGNGEFVVRFLPQKAGEYTWKVNGVVEAEGSDICEEAAGDAHGVVKAVDTHFEFEDGTPFLPFGTTVYALPSQEDALVDQTLETLKNAPFNKVRMCVFPKHYDYNHNEPLFYAFEKNADGDWDVERPCIAFWQRFEKIVDRINALGIQVDLILFHPYDNWGFDALSQRDNLLYLDYLLRRLSAKPGIWWSLANEYDLSRSKTLADWEEIECFVAGNDPYRHPLSVHNCLAFWDHTRPNITHVSLQTKALTEIPRWLKAYNKPVVIDECCYEGDLSMYWGSISGREMVNRFWRAYASGGFCTHGETFLDENDVLWWAKGGVLKGKSPRRIAFLREVIELLPGPLTPMSEGFQAAVEMSEEELHNVVQYAPSEYRVFVESILRMDPRERQMHVAAEHVWMSHCAEEAYLWFNDHQCYGEMTLNLPEDKQYRVECLDSWEMTRLLIANKASGKTTIRLPYKEGLAVLATRMR